MYFGIRNYVTMQWIYNKKSVAMRPLTQVINSQF
jgi:hypothetical protein